VARRVTTPIAHGYAAVIDAIVQLVAWLEDAAGGRCAIGIGTPGQISRRHGCMKNSNATCLNDQPLEVDLERALGRSIRLSNDANCFTLSEAIDGAAAEHDVVFGVILGTGVGGALSVNKRVLAGRHGIAGEWGHIALEPSDLPCYCGRMGCVEMFLSGMGLVRSYQQAGGLRALDAIGVARLAERGQDPLAARAVATYTERLGRALSLIVNVVDPDAIVLGGGLSNMSTLYKGARQAMQPHVFNDLLDVPLLKHAHGDASGVRGAAMLWSADEVPAAVGARTAPEAHEGRLKLAVGRVESA
jgi:fructokinase